MTAIILLDHPAWVALQENITKNMPEYLIFFSALAVAFVCTWPENIPRSAQEWWKWARDMFQTAVPAARSSNNHQVPPSPPVTDPNAPKK